MTELNNAPVGELRYRVESTLGQGGFGRVYRAYDTQLERTVAIKVVHQPSSNLSQEARALARVSSGHVVTLYDFIAFQGQPAIVMEYIDNANTLTLDALKHLSVDAFFDFFEPLTRGVMDIHREDLVHGDIKLNNILISPSNEVKLTDFGLARLSQHRASVAHPHAKQTSGSWECFSPEQLQGMPPSKPGDIFALGILLYAVLYGKHPFITDQDPASTRKNLQRPLDFGQVSLVNTPLAELQDLCASALHHKPQKRPDIGQFLEQLLSVKQRIKQPSAGAVTETITIDTEPRTWHRKGLYTAVGLVLVLLLVAFYTQYKPAIKTTLVVPTRVVNKAIDLHHQHMDLLQKSKAMAVIMDDELVDAVISHDRRRLIPKREWLGDTNWTRVANQLQADEILFSEIQCESQLICKVKISLYSAGLKAVSKVKELSVPSENLLIFSELVSDAAIEFVGGKKKRFKSDAISEAALRAYAEFVYNNKKYPLPELIAQLESLSEKNPSIRSIKLKLGINYLHQFEASQDKAWLKKAQGVAGQISNSGSGLELQFWIHLFSKNFHEAQLVLERLQQLPYIDYTYLALRNATLLYDQGNKEEAKNYLLSLTDIRKSGSYYHVLCYILEGLGDYKAVLRTTDTWLERSPGNSHVNQYRLIALIHLGQLEEAATLGAKMLEKNATPFVLSNLSIVLLLQGKFDASIDLLMQLRQSQPQNRSVLFNLADAWLGLGDSTRANQYYRDFIEATRKLEQLQWRDLAYLALAYAQLEQPTNALLSLQQMSAKALANQKTEDSMYFLFSSQIYALIGQKKAALINGEKALHLGQGLHWYSLPWFSELQQALTAKQHTRR